MSNFKVVTDGTILGTQIFADGKDMSKVVRSFRVEQMAGKKPVLHLEIYEPVIEVTTFGAEFRKFAKLNG